MNWNDRFDGKQIETNRRGSRERERKRKRDWKRE